MRKAATVCCGILTFTNVLHRFHLILLAIKTFDSKEESVRIKMEFESNQHISKLNRLIKLLFIFAKNMLSTAIVHWVVEIHSNYYIFCVACNFDFNRTICYEINPLLCLMP